MYHVRRAGLADVPQPSPETVAGFEVAIDGVSDKGRPKLRCTAVVWMPELLEEIAETLRATADNLAAGITQAAFEGGDES
jgi:hypothetical protein